MMKVNFLRLTDADFIKNGHVWISPVIDLYENDNYINYSVTKSSYGVGFTGTWIGLERTDLGRPLTWDELQGPWGEDFPTDTGRILNDRYIDHSGRIDLVSFSATKNPSLRVFTSDQSDDTYYQQEWAAEPVSSPAEEIGITGSDRYAKFELTFLSDPVDPVEVLVRVEIDRPVIAPLYSVTRGMLNQFPEWMDLHLPIEEQGATPELATPTSLGGSFLNAISAEWLEDTRKQLSYREFQQYITTVDLNQMAWCYKATLIPEMVWSVEGDGIQLARTTEDEFFLAVDDDACYIDENERVLYSVKEYTELRINGDVYHQEVHHVWNYIDEIGLFVDLPRLHLEGNESYQKRILDVYKNRGGVGVESLKLALRRELNIWKAYGATPDSDYEGATPTILEMEDLENDPKYFAPDGMPTRAFVELVEDLSHRYPTTWGRFVWNKAVWDIAGNDYAGYGTVPYRYDPAELDDPYIQSGVGDGDDLFVFRPDVITGPRDFTYKLKLRGREKVARTEYPVVEFDVAVQGRGLRDEYDNPTKTVWFTLEVNTNGATPGTYVHSFTLSSQSDVDVTRTTPSESSFALYDIFDAMGETTRPELVFVDSVTNVPYENDGTIPLEEIGSIVLRHGKWVAGTYENLETQDHFEAWFSETPANVVAFDQLSSTLTWSADATPVFPVSYVVMKSLLVATPVSTVWTTDLFKYKVKVNGVEPALTPTPVTIDLPTMIWDPYVTSKVVDLKLETTNSYLDPATVEYGGITFNEDGDIVFVPSSLIQANGTAGWSSAGVKTISADTTSVEFATDNTTTTYPLTFHIWNLFENEQIITSNGVVDENGPWRNGSPPVPGNKNFALNIFESLTRDDFGVPNNSNYVVTWIGVSNDNPRVITWLDSNTVHPAIVDDLIEYPETALSERIEEGVYYYEPVIVRARVRPDPDPQWNPQVHSGYFYDHKDEYYFYANKKVEEATTNEIILSEVARQGAPIIVSDDATPVRQVAFMDSATPVSLSLTNSQTVRGNGTTTLYLAYDDVYDVVVTDSAGVAVGAATSSGTNQIATTVLTSPDEEYTVTYKVRNSFIADHDYIHTDGSQRTKIIFDATPQTGYSISYEASDYDPATPVDLPLNPLFTVQNEGFIYISHNEYTLESVRVRLSAPKILADGVDYVMISLLSLDSNGNPKPEQVFNLSTTWGTLSLSQVTTDRDGFAVALLNSTEIAATSGTLTITGGVNASISFEVEEPKDPEPALFATVKAEQIQADGVSQNIVYGRLINPQQEPVVGVTVSWDKARSLYELFEGIQIYDSGVVTTNNDGAFVIGPFTATNSGDSGYWFLACEATVNGVVVGDVVFWYEYPVIITGTENVDGLPQQPVQMATPVDAMPSYATGVKYPVSYDEAATPLNPEMPTINWLPPTWYAIDAWTQYQMGIDTHKVNRNA